MAEFTIPDDAPAWVHAALDEYVHSNGKVTGFNVLTTVDYPDLQHTDAHKHVEDVVFKTLRNLAFMWARAGFRLWIDPFEQALMQCEIEALRNPLAMKAIGENHYSWRNDAFVYHKVSQLMGARGYVVGPKQAQDMLGVIDGIYQMADHMAVEVRVLSKYEERPDTTDKTILLLQTALQKAA